MPRRKSKQTRRTEKWAKQRSQQGISWNTVIAILASVAAFVGAVVNGLDFINYLREDFQQFVWLGFTVLGIIWLIILWLLFKQRNIYGILWFIVTVLAGVIIWNGWSSYIQTREEKLVVLITKFDGPEDVYGLRNEILEKLNTDFANDMDVEIESVNEVITPDSDSGSSRARKLGESLQADIVIWGWYRPTENPNITIHIENLNLKLTEFETLKDGKVYQPQVTLAELEAFMLQKQLGSDTSNLISFLNGMLYYNSGNYQVAIERFEQLTRADETSTILNYYDLYSILGFSHLHVGNYESALKNWNAAIKIDSKQAEAYQGRGVVYAKLGDYQIAIQEFNAALDFDPQLTEVYYNLAVIYESVDDYQRAIQNLDEAIQINPQFAWAYQVRGLVYLKSGDYRRAIVDFDMAIQIDPEFLAAYGNRGIAYDKLEEYKLAIQDFNKIISLDSQDERAYLNRGLAYSNINNFRSAIQDLDKAILLNPQYAEAYHSRGLVYALLGQNQIAIEDFNKAIEINPQLADAYLGRGLTYQALGKSSDAETDFKKYEELTGQKP